MHDPPVRLHRSPRTRPRVVEAGPYEAPQGRDYPPHQHVTWEFAYYRCGHILCPIGDEVYRGEPGVLLLTPPGVPHAERALTAYANYFIQIAAPADMPWPRLCLDDAERSFERVCGAMVRECCRHLPERERMLDALLEQLTILIQRAEHRRGLSAAERLVREVERLLEARYALPITIGDIAREVGIAPSTLRAHFARLRGYPPSAHLHAVRVQRALSIIRDSTLALETIAELCGYNSASHLSRQVKRATGHTPGSFRGRGSRQAHLSAGARGRGGLT